MKDDQCEALEVSYRTVRKIEIVSGQAERSVVNVRVDAPPVIGKIPVKSSTTAPLTVYFTLSLADMDRFCCAIRSRGLVRTPYACPIIYRPAETYT